ncbi:hypothetical protein TEA_016672 [Camellia sinensis var. sinensis]|uniref:FBD domain-containing protein n=1 Tax=Camellia sinensis var. sinensis TaxID=542762 RepID=A0A4S4E344_CAMSN|nr:hypothetical protein TEA_016672 [Camellia sinensis var. sinensis]
MDLWCWSEVDEKGAETASGDSRSWGGGGSMEVIGCSDFYLFLLYPCLTGAYVVWNFIWIIFSLLQFWDFKDSTKETKIRRPKHLHKSLKVLELNGFIGCKADLQIASYILGSTVSLREIIIDPSHPNKWAPEDPDKQQLARTHARQHLETRLPFGTQLVLR